MSRRRAPLRAGEIDRSAAYSAADLKRQSLDKQWAAELAAAQAREENEFLRARVAQLEAREARLMTLLKKIADDR